MATLPMAAPGITGENDIIESPLDKLTPREREVLSMIGEGMSLMDIAKRLHRGYATIKSHRLMLGRKLGVTNRVELARIAIQTGLTPLENPSEPSDLNIASHSLVSSWNAEKIMLAIEKGTANKSGSDYFAALVEHLAKAVGVRCVLLGELQAPNTTTIRSIAVWLDDRRVENFEFDFKGTPCERAILEGMYFCKTAVSDSFSAGIALGDFSPDSYAGAAMLSHPGQPIGILAVINDTPMNLGFEAQAILRIFAGLAAMELEVMKGRRNNPAA